MVKTIISPVRAIKSPREDWMHRQPFAEKLAEAILGWEQPDSLVIGLYGKWGSGKSSIKNLCTHYLAKQDGNPQILEFSPWLFSNEEQLFDTFFRELGVKANTFETPSERKKFDIEWRRYVAILKLGYPLAAISPAVIAAMSHTLGIQDPTIAIATATAIARAAEMTKPYFEATEAATELASLKSTSRKESKNKSQAVSPTLDEVKQGITRRLQRKGHRGVLVVIDELDRLRPEYIRMMVQLVKACADFPRIVYLLCYDREVVEKALTTEAYSGRDYLAKIIQVGFNIPEASPETLHGQLEAEIMSLLSPELRASWDSQRWKLALGKLKQAFATPRDVYRYLNALSFQLNVFRREEGLEVNPIDLAVVEMIRLFEADFHQRLYQSKTVLFDAAIRYGLVSGRSNEKYRKESLDRVDALLATASPAQREWCKSALLFLFPFLSSVYDTARLDKTSPDTWDMELRICDERAFERYFLLTVPSNDLTQQETNALLRSLSNQSKILALLRDYRRRNMLELVVGKLDSCKSRIPADDAVTYFLALMQISDEVGKYDLATWTIDRYLLNIADVNTRDQLAVKACRNSKVLAPMVHLVRSLYEDGRKIVGQEALKQLTAIAVRCLRRAAQTGELLSHPWLPTLTFSWARWAPVAEVKTEMIRLMKPEDAFWIAMESAFQLLPDDKLPSGDDVDPFFGIDLSGIKKWFEQFTDSAAVGLRLRQEMDTHELNKRQQQIISCFEYMFSQRDIEVVPS